MDVEGEDDHGGGRGGLRGEGEDDHDDGGLLGGNEDDHDLNDGGLLGEGEGDRDGGGLFGGNEDDHDDGGLLGGNEDDLALRLEVVKQVKLSGSDVAKVHGLEVEKAVNHHMPPLLSFQFLIVSIVITWNKRRTNFPRKFAKSKVVAVPALKQGTLLMKSFSRKSKKDGKAIQQR